MEHMTEVFYVSHGALPTRVDVAKFFTQEHADAFVAENGHLHDLRIDKKTEPWANQSPSHRPG